MRCNDVNETTRKTVGHVALVKAGLRTFWQDQFGAANIMQALVIFWLIIIAGGMAVDLTRMESQRVRVQQTLDRAVLAAADLDNQADPQTVVEDYFAKSGLSNVLKDVTVEQTIAGKTVTAQTESDIITMFLHMVGVNTLSADASGGAEERVTDIEISLVVDISGSMTENDATGTQTKLKTLQTAASTFFDLVINEQTEETGITMVSVIPYNFVVNTGDELLSYFNTTDWHDYHDCVRFYDSDFFERAIDQSDTTELVGHIWLGNNSYATPSGWSSSLCPDSSNRAILPFQTDATVLTNYVNALTATGMTAVDSGMKWASALLDPSVQNIVTGMISSGSVDPMLAGWPRAYGTDGTMKVVVLMTDGINTDKDDLDSQYKSGDGINPAMSDIYYSDSSGSSDPYDGWYVYFAANDYWERWYRPGDPTTTNDDTWIAPHNMPNDLIQYSYQDIFSLFATYDAGDYFYYYSDPDGYWDIDCGYYNCWWAWHGDIPQGHDNLSWPYVAHDTYDNADTRLRNICDTFKEEEVLVFTIAFEAPTDAQTELDYCASSDGHSYDVNGADLETAFKSVASQINHLRLIQ